MGSIDSKTKDYMNHPQIFADAFNQYVYGGEEVIRPESLREVDTTEVVMPYGTDGVKVPAQRYRDLMKMMVSMTDGRTAYCILALENESKIHYAMPARNMLYDAMQYANQITAAGKQYRAGLVKTSHDEYMSNFRKDDRLLPVVTLVLYFGADEWDAPRTLREMYSDCDERLVRLAPDYHMNLIAPYHMTDEEIGEFRTTLRELMLYIKYSRDMEKLDDLLGNDPRFRHLDREAADLINTVTNSNLKFPEGEEEVDMCLAIREMREASKGEGLKEGLKEGLQQGLLSAVRSLMSKQGMSADEALDVLDIPETDRPGYLAML